MIEIDERGIYLINFEKHQNLDGLDRIRELGRQRAARCRERKKLLSGVPENCNVTNNATVTDDNALDIDIERDKEKDKDICPFTEIKDLFNSKCLSLQKVQKLTNSRKNKLSARWKELPDIKQWEQLFIEVECTSFLIGKNDRGWKASFDWLIANDSNYTKVLEGQYANQQIQRDRFEGIIT